MIKKVSILFALIFQCSFAQVGIGTTTPSASSALDIKSSNSGLLIPRVTLQSTTDVTTILSPETSLLVFNTTPKNDVVAGFYYWEGSWKPLKSATTASSGWNLTGNTVTTTDYIGTNNNSPLLFKVNNAQFAKFHQNGGITIGNLATANDDRAIAIGTSTKATAQNGTAIGYNAEAAQDATALGYGAKSTYQSVSIGLNATTTGNTNVAIGANAKVTAQNGIAIGTTTEATQDGTAIGNVARATGYQATAIGNSSSASGQNSTAIGNQVVATQANSVIIGNSSNKIGIGTSTPDERLHVAGSIKIVDGTQSNNYVLTSDATGKATWKDPNSLKAFGEIYKTTGTALNSGAINFGVNGVSSNVTLNGDNIQVQTTGIYRVIYTISIEKNTTPKITPEFYLTIYGTEIPGTRTFATVNNNDTRTVTISKLVSLNAYQAVSVYSNLANSDTTILANGSSLSVELLK